MSRYLCSVYGHICAYVVDPVVAMVTANVDICFLFIFLLHISRVHVSDCMVVLGPGLY